MSITLDGDVVTGERLIQGLDLDKEVPCELDLWHDMQGHTEMPPAKWRIIWDNAEICKCRHFKAPTLVCDPCKDQVLGSKGIECMKCLKVFPIGRAILRIEPL